MSATEQKEVWQKKKEEKIRRKLFAEWQLRRWPTMMEDMDAAEAAINEAALVAAAAAAAARPVSASPLAG